MHKHWDLLKKPPSLRPGHSRQAPAAPEESPGDLMCAPSATGCGHPHTIALSSFVDDMVTSSTSESSALSRKRFTLQGFANLKGQKGKRHSPQIHALDVSLTVVACLSSIRVVIIHAAVP